MKFLVIAQSFNRSTAKELGPVRKELIDTQNNILFKHCKNILQVKERYESFWNETDPKSKEVVFVSKIIPA